MAWESLAGRFHFRWLGSPFHPKACFVPFPGGVVVSAFLQTGRRWLSKAFPFPTSVASLW